MKYKENYDYAKTRILAELRRKAGLSQDQAAEFLGLAGKKRRDAVSEWELGKGRPALDRRDEFIVYLLGELNLRRDLQAFERLWGDVMVGQWGWRPLSDRERRQYRSEPGAVLPPQRVVNASVRPDVRPKFHDRTAELAWLRACLAEPSTRLIAVVGRGGFGKTALVARTTIDAETGSLALDGRELKVRGVAYFHHKVTGLTLGRLYEDLAAMLGDPFASILTNRWQDPAGSLQQKAGFLLEQVMRAAQDDEVILIVLDALEGGLDDYGQVADKGLRLWLEACLEARGPFRFIVTSRQKFLLPDGTTPYVRQWNLESGLPEGDGVAVLRALDPDGHCHLRQADELLLYQAVMQTEGIPFSLEKIAGLMRKDPQISLKKLLDDEGLFQQQVTLALADRAFSHLLPKERRVMEVLAIYGRPAPAAAVAFVLYVVVGKEEVALVEATLVELAHGYFVAYQREAETWALHEVDAEVVCARLSPEEQAALHRRAGEYYALSRDARDLVRAVHHLQQGGDYARAVELTTENVEVIVNRGLASELRQVLEEFSAEQLETRQWGEVNLARGYVYTFLGERDLAEEGYKEALAHLEAVPASPVLRERRAKTCRGMARLLANEAPDEALAWLQRALDELAGASALEEAEVFLRMGSVLILQDEYGEAVEALERGLRLLPEGSDDLQARLLGNLGVAWCSQGDLQQGGEYFQRALEIFRRLQDRWGEVGALHNLGMIKEYTGDWAGATNLYQEALRVAEQLGDVERWVELESSVGILQMKRGAYDSSLAHLSRFLELAGSHLRQQMVYAYASLADLRIRRGELKEAEAALGEAERLALEMPARSRLPEIYRLRAEMRLAQGEVQAALDLARKAVNEAREIEGLDPLEEGTSLRVLGQALWADGQNESAVEAFEQSLALLEDRDDYEAARTKAQWGRTLLSGGDAEGGTNLLQEAQDKLEELGAKSDLAEVKGLP